MNEDKTFEIRVSIELEKTIRTDATTLNEARFYAKRSVRDIFGDDVGIGIEECRVSMLDR